MGTKVVQTFESPRVKPDQIDVTTAATGAALVATNTTQTLTNKTLTSPTLTSPTITTPIMTINAATLAAAGDAIGNAGAIVTSSPGFVLVTGADGTKGVRLPTAAAGNVFWIKNIEAANAVLKVYPPSGGTINDETANTAVAPAANTAYLFIAYNSTAYYTWPNI